MKYELNEKSFFVKEILNPKLSESGEYYYYLLTKSGISDKEMRQRIPRDALFCGKKDKHATTIQWFSTKYKIDDINEKNLKVEYRGVSSEKLFIGKHKGNTFRVKVELSESELKKLKKTNFKKSLIANYFGEQRFDDRINEFSELIQKEDYEGALKFFLTKESKFDSEKSTQIKKEILNNWENWKKIIESEIIPESKKDIFKSLEKENDFLGAFEFAEKKSLKIMLKGVQAKKWNKLLHNEICEKVKNNLKGFLCNKNIKPKINLKSNKIEKKFNINDFERSSYFIVNKLKIKPLGKNYYELGFTLPKGVYATTFLKALEELLK